MRQFFVQELKSLRMNTGLRQFEEIQSITKKEEAQQALDNLLRGLINVCNTFSYIPDTDKQKIISKNIITDHEMIALNPRTVYKWLHQVSDRYYQESGHSDTNKLLEKPIEALSFDQLTPETQKLVEDFKTSLIDSMPQMPAITQRDIDLLKKEDEERVKLKAISAGHAFKSRRYAFIKYLHEAGLDDLAKVHETREASDWVYNFTIENRTVVAKDLSEAQEIFAEMYA